LELRHLNESLSKQVTNFALRQETSGQARRLAGHGQMRCPSLLAAKGQMHLRAQMEEGPTTHPAACMKPAGLTALRDSAVEDGLRTEPVRPQRRRRSSAARRPAAKAAPLCRRRPPLQLPRRCCRLCILLSTVLGALRRRVASVRSRRLKRSQERVPVIVVDGGRLVEGLHRVLAVLVPAKAIMLSLNSVCRSSAADFMQQGARKSVSCSCVLWLSLCASIRGLMSSLPQVNPVRRARHSALNGVEPKQKQPERCATDAGTRLRFRRPSRRAHLALM